MLRQILQDANLTYIKAIYEILVTVDIWINDIPPLQQSHRFGNLAFRTFIAKLESDSLPLLDNTIPHLKLAFIELQSYLLGGFGSGQRLDYGTGHELSFLAFISGIHLIVPLDLKFVGTLLIPQYIRIARKLIQKYNLEPAGSHGVWGLDDHFFVPYLLGSAQLIPRDDSPPTSSVTDSKVVSEWKDKNMYFDAISFILQVKSGPFFEHSPILYNVSGVPTWSKINKVCFFVYG